MTIMVQNNEYTIEQRESLIFPYVLIGKRGGRTLLLRDARRSEILKAEPGKGITELFTDMNGSLEIANVLRVR